MPPYQGMTILPESPPRFINLNNYFGQSNGSLPRYQNVLNGMAAAVHVMIKLSRCVRTDPGNDGQKTL